MKQISTAILKEKMASEKRPQARRARQKEELEKHQRAHRKEELEHYWPICVSRGQGAEACMQVQKSAAAKVQSEQKASEAAWWEAGYKKLFLDENREVYPYHVPLAMDQLCASVPYMQHH